MREAHIVCASDGTVLMPEQKIIGLKVKEKYVVQYAKLEGSFSLTLFELTPQLQKI